MSTERLEQSRGDFRELKGVGQGFVNEKGVRKVERDLRWLSKLTSFEGNSNQNLQLASELVKQGDYLVFYGNHTHHGNVGVYNDIIETLDPRPNDVYITVSRRLSEEGQEEGLVKFSQNFEALRSPQGIHQIPFIVDRDLEKLRQNVKDGAMSRDKLKQLIHESRENRNTLFETLYDDAMFMVWPETTTEGGVYDEKIGKRKGMIRVSSQILVQMYEEGMRRGRRVSFVPVSVNGFQNVLEPRSRNVKTNAKLNIALSYIGYGEQLIRVNVGQPIGDEFFAEKGLVQINGKKLDVVDSQEFTDSLMGEVAAGLDEELRGEYAAS